MPVGKYKPTAKERRVAERVLADFDTFKEALQHRHKRFADYLEHYCNEKQFERKPGQANVPVPLATETIDTVHADIMEKIIGPDGLLIDVAPEEGTDVQQAEASHDLIRYQAYQDDMAASISEMVKTSLLYGTAPGKVSYTERWESYTRRVPVMDMFGRAIGETSSRDERIVYKGPTAVPIDIFDFYPHPDMVDIDDDLPVIHRFLATPEYIAEFARQGTFKNAKYIDWDEQELDESTQMDNQEKLRRKEILGIKTHTATRKAVECYEWQGMYDLEENGERQLCVLVVTDKGIVLRAEELPYDSKQKTYVTMTIFPIPGEFWGVGLVEKQHAMIHAVNSLNNTLLDDLYQSVHPPRLVNSRGLQNEAELVRRKSQTIHINPKQGEPLEAYYKELQPQMVAPDAWKAMGTYFEWAERAAGAADFMKGHMPSKVQTATAIQTTFTQASAKFKFILQMIENTGIIPICRKMQAINLQFLDQETVIRIIGRPGLHWRTISPADIAGQVHFIALGSSREIDKGVNIQQLMQALQIAAGNEMLQQLVPVLFLALTDQFRLPHREMIQDILQWEQQKNAYYEQLRMQITQMQMQQGQVPQLPPPQGQAQGQGMPGGQLPEATNQQQLTASMNARNRTYIGGALQ